MLFSQIKQEEWVCFLLFSPKLKLDVLLCSQKGFSHSLPAEVSLSYEFPATIIQTLAVLE